MAAGRPPLYSGKYKIRELLTVQGVNLLKWSEDCRNSVWTKSNIAVDSATIISPIQTNTARKIFGSLNSIGANVSQTVSNLPFNTQYNFSTYLKPAGFNYAALSIEALSSFSGNTQSVGKITVVLDLSSGQITNTTPSVSAVYNKDYTLDITENNWIRFSITGNPYIKDIENLYSSAVTCSIKTTITPLSSPTDSVETATNGNNNSGIYVWGSQLQIGKRLPPYVQTTNNTDWKIFKYGGQAGNLIYYSQDFNISDVDRDGVQQGWIKTNVAAITNDETSPRGLKEASKITETAINGKHLLYHDKSKSNTGQYTASVYAKKGERKHLQISQDNNTIPAIFDLEAGTVFQKGDFDAYITEVGGGWFRCEAVYNNKPSTSGFKIMAFGPSDGIATNGQYQGITGRGIYVWGAQVERTGWAGEQIVTAGATFTRFSHYDFSNQDVVEPSLTMPNNINHLYWSDVFDDPQTTWDFANGARVIRQTGTIQGYLIPERLVPEIGYKYGSRLIEGITASSQGFNISQTHNIKYEWDKSYDGRYTFSIFVRSEQADTNYRRYVRLDLDALTVTKSFFGKVYVVIDAATGAITVPPTTAGNAFIPRCKVTNATGGWWRVEITGFFGKPDALSSFDQEILTTFDGQLIEIFGSLTSLDDLEEFLNNPENEKLVNFIKIFNKFDINAVKNIVPRITLCNNAAGNINYTGNNNRFIDIWGAQLEAGPKASVYASNTTGKTKAYDASFTRVTPNTVNYFPIIMYARNEITLQFFRDASYDKTRRATGDDTLVLYNNKLGFGNPDPTFTLDISGSIRGTTSLIPVISTASLKGDNTLSIENFSKTNINSDLELFSNTLVVDKTLSADNLRTTVAHYFSTLNIPISVGSEEFNQLLINPNLITQNVTVGEVLSAKTITARNAFITKDLNTSTIEVEGNFIPEKGQVRSNISPKNLLYYTEEFNNSYWENIQTSIAANDTTAPNGTNTADKLTDTGTQGWPRLLKNVYVTSDRAYAYSIHAKFGGQRYIGIDIRETTTTLSIEQLVTPRVSMVVDLQNGSIVSPLIATSSSQALSAGVNNLGNGWYRIGIVFKPNITPLTPRDPSFIRTRVSILNDISPATLAIFNTVIEPPIGSARDVDAASLEYTGTAGNGIYLWGAQLEYAEYTAIPAVTQYEKNTNIILPDIYTNRVFGKVPIDPAQTNPVGYTPGDDLRVSRDVTLTVGIKPSDSFSTDDSTEVRALTGAWDYDHNADELEVVRPFFRSLYGVTDYINKSGLSFGTALNILVYEDIAGNVDVPNKSPWPAGHPRHNPSPTVPTDQSGTLSTGTLNSGQSRLPQRFGTAGQIADFFTTEWLGANYPALTAAGLRGGIYCWKEYGSISNPQNALAAQTSWHQLPIVYRILRNINYLNINIQGLFDIKPDIGNAAPTPPANYNLPGNQYLQYFIKDKPFNKPTPKLLARVYVCRDRLKRYYEPGKTTNNNGLGYFGTGNGDPSLFLTNTIKRDTNGWWRHERVHAVQFQLRQNCQLNFKNITFEVESNASDGTGPLWTYGNITLSNTTLVNRGSVLYHHWGTFMYDEGYIGIPAADNFYNGEYQIDPYFLTPTTWNTDVWKNVKGATSKAYMPGFALACVGNMPYTTSAGVTSHPYPPTNGYTLFRDQSEQISKSTYIDKEASFRSFGRNAHHNSSLIIDGHFCSQANVRHRSYFSKTRKGTVQTTGYIFKGDNYFEHDWRTGTQGINTGAPYLRDEIFPSYYGTYLSNPGTVSSVLTGTTFTILRDEGAFTNLFNTNVGIAPWKLDGSLPPAIPYPGTAIYYITPTPAGVNPPHYNSAIEGRTMVPLRSSTGAVTAVDFTGYLAPIDWYNQQKYYVFNIDATSTGTEFDIPGTEPFFNFYSTTANIYTSFFDNDWVNASTRNSVTVDGHVIPPLAYSIRTTNRKIIFNQWFRPAWSASVPDPDPLFSAQLTAISTYRHVVTTPGVTVLQLEQGPRLPSGSDNYKVTIYQTRTRTRTVLPAGNYTINPTTRRITFTSSIPVDVVSAGTPQVGPPSGPPSTTLYTYNSPTVVLVEQLAIAQGSQINITGFVINDVLTPIKINTIVENRPYYVRTDDNRLLLSSFRSPNEIDSYRNWYTIQSPHNGQNYTLVYYTTATKV